MSNATNVQIEIDPRLTRDERLGPAVQAATEFFFTQADKRHISLSPTGRLSWGLLADRPGVLGVERAYSEPNPDGRTKRVNRTAFSASTVLDPVEREVLMLRLLEDVLMWRLDEVNTRIADQLKELDTEEQNGLAH
jgi:hypothetical protein